MEIVENNTMKIDWRIECRKLLKKLQKLKNARASHADAAGKRCCKGSCTNHVDSKGGGGVGKMSTFVYVGGRGGWDNVYMVFFPYNFT